MEIPRLKVTVHPIYFQGTVEGSAEYEQRLTIAQYFAEYWKNGYSPDFGRDRPLERPDGIEESALCKVHVLVSKIPQKEKEFWDSKSSPNLAPFDRSHCDSCDAVVVYAVSEQGRALVLALYPDNAHDLLKKPYFNILKGLGEHAKAYFKSVGEQPALEQDLLDFLRKPTC